MKSHYFSSYTARAITAALSLTLSLSSVLAFAPRETQAFFNGPSVSDVGSRSVRVSLSAPVLSSMTEAEKASVYIEYFETRKVCIMIYPTPEECLPKKLPLGQLQATISDLKPNTEYQVTYKFDTTVRCITTPCPENNFESLPVVFTTKPAEGVGGDGNGGASGGASTSSGLIITRTLSLGARGEDVVELQKFLNTRGFLTASPTGYYGLLTRQAMKKYQASYGISQTGTVGPLTRAKLSQEKL